MIEVKNLSKHFGTKTALDNISFSVKEGEVLGFLGPNGAGKSTTMNIITGYISSSEGSVSISEHDILKEPKKAKSNIGYLPEQPPIYPDMTVREYLNFVFDLKKVCLPKQEHIAEICNLVKIDNVYDRLIKHLSKGYKQRVGLAQALLGYPKVIILDEPTVGLDPKQIIEIRDLITKLKDNHTIILSSHILSEVQSICNRILVINQGKIIADDTPENLSNNISNKNTYIAKIKGETDKISNILNSMDEISEFNFKGEKEAGIFELEIISKNDIDIRPTLFKSLSTDDVQILELSSSKMNLEDIFLKLTQQEEKEASTDDSIEVDSGDSSDDNGLDNNAHEQIDNLSDNDSKNSENGGTKE